MEFKTRCRMTYTDNFTEVSHPLDKDLRDDAVSDRSQITRFRNANLSLKELEIAGLALINYQYNETYRYAVAMAKPCDPNILGMISDLMLEVDTVDTCLVYSIQPFGVKISVRSCVKEVKAGELAEMGYVDADQVFPLGTKICVRTLEGDLDVITRIRVSLYNAEG